jgi:uroporphyrinogen decarboxylase
MTAPAAFRSPAPSAAAPDVPPAPAPAGSPAAAAGGQRPAAGPFLRAARGLPVERTPVWFMRQAGRTLPEYRKVRERHTLLEICRIPDVCAEVTLQPMRRLPLDAAVMFGDIMIPLVGVGRRPRHRREGRAGGRRAGAHDGRRGAPAAARRRGRLRADPRGGAHRAARARAGPRGARASRGAVHARVVPDRGAADARLRAHQGADARRARDVGRAHVALCDIVVAFLRANAAAGADALQLFDSWVGALSATDYARHVRPYTQRIFAELRDLGVPLVHFRYRHRAPARPDEGRRRHRDRPRLALPLDEAWARVGHHLGVQGNLDPAVLSAPLPVVEEAARDVLRRAGGRPGTCSTSATA